MSTKLNSKAYFSKWNKIKRIHSKWFINAWGFKWNCFSIFKAHPQDDHIIASDAEGCEASLALESLLLRSHMVTSNNRYLASIGLKCVKETNLKLLHKIFTGLITFVLNFDRDIYFARISDSLLRHAEETLSISSSIIRWLKSNQPVL